MEDKRFAHIANDPKFRRIPKAQSKVKIDGRFQSMFTDKKFQLKYTTDKRGRPVKHHSTEDLKRYYELSSEDNTESSESECELESNQPEPGRLVKAPKSEDSDEEESSESEVDEEENEKESQDNLIKKHENDKKLPDHIKKKIRDLNIDYARGEQTLFSESSSDDEETDEEISDSEEIDHRWGELDADAEQTEKPTYRLAACNLDWDRIRAMDLMVLFNSFLPPGGVIQSVNIYPSEFGKQRMKEEEVKGPIELVEVKNDEEYQEETEDGSKYHMERLRQYQLNRLKYYYAVITFDSVNSADKIYTECDGREYESSATKMDLRFIPDDMTFDDIPKDSCAKLPDKYEPRFFTTTALQQAKVELTWDETNPDRLEIAEKMNTGKLADLTENDLKNYLACSSSGEEGSEDEKNDKSDSEESQSENVIDKYKALLSDIKDKEEKKNKDFEMEISWGIGIKEKTDKMVKEKMEHSEEKTPFEKYLDKRREKRKERKQLKKKSKEQNDSEDSDIPSDIDMNDPYFAEEFNNPEFKKKSSKKKNKREDLSEDDEEDRQKQAELDLLLMNEEESDKKHFSLKKIQDKESESKSKKKKKKNKKGEEKNAKAEDDFQINIDDKRFSALFTSHHFNIDPTDPHYRKTKGTETLIKEKIKRRNEGTTEHEENKKAKKEENKNKNRHVELNMLVKSVKRNAKAFKSNK